MIYKETKNMPIEKMNRTDIIFDLARFAHPTWYHALLCWPTEFLAALLVFYRSSK